MIISKLLSVSLIAVAIASTVVAGVLPTKKFAEPQKDLYEVFKNPDSRHRAYVRWWWNGSRINENEILRELDLMKEAGIGGVEINTISFPENADSVGCAALPWLSEDWLKMVDVAAEGCKQRGMVCDIIVGSGWPFGAEFLTHDQQIRMLALGTINVEGGKPFTISQEEIFKLANPPIAHINPNSHRELLYLRLMPKHVDKFTEGISYDNLVTNNTINIDVPEGEYVLYCFVKMVGYMKVIEGAPGASGPVVNHFDAKAVDQFLNRFSDKMNFNGAQMKGKVRAAFTDSFELEGANWDEDMLNEFQKRKGYSLLPYLPYVVRRVGAMGEPVREPYGSTFSEQITKDVINRVRNDFEHVQTDLFHENFILTYNKWCHRNGLKSRVQAYGRQLHPIESAMYLDIPECESWIHDNIGLTMKENQYLDGRGYSMVNKFVSSGAFLSGNRIVSCEEQTNVGGIFQTTLEELKITGDRSNISGVNHSILHGFNYSPQQDDFLGWIKFGTYFSENNTWWPQLRLWMDYKARMSALLQNCDIQADIAILPPLEDMWSTDGQQRDPYPGVTYPKYANDLWESLNQSGNGCDYISESVIQQAKVVAGRLTFGPRSYKTILLMEVESMNPKTADMLAGFVAKGGRVICIGKTPDQSVGLKDAEQNGAKVKAVADKLKSTYPDRFITVASPQGTILDWYVKLQKQYNLTPFIKIDKPDKFLMQNYYKSADKDIFFIANASINRVQDITVGFPENVKGKQAWLWDAETGERYMIEAPRNGEMKLRFAPAESKLIVFDNVKDGKMLPAMANGDKPIIALDGKWRVKATHHVEKTVKEFDIVDLVDFHTMPFPWIKNFAGTLEYSRVIDVHDPSMITVLDAGLTHNGVTELFVNDEKIGTKWYSERKFDVSKKLKKGSNTITIKVTTLLANYVKSRVEDTPNARRWEWALRYNKELGLRGPVVLY